MPRDLESRTDAEAVAAWLGERPADAGPSDEQLAEAARRLIARGVLPTPTPGLECRGWSFLRDIRRQVRKAAATMAEERAEAEGRNDHGYPNGIGGPR